MGGDRRKKRGGNIACFNAKPRPKRAKPSRSEKKQASDIPGADTKKQKTRKSNLNTLHSRRVELRQSLEKKRACLFSKKGHFYSYDIESDFIGVDFSIFVQG